MISDKVIKNAKKTGLTASLADLETRLLPRASISEAEQVKLHRHAVGEERTCCEGLLDL